MNEREELDLDIKPTLDLLENKAISNNLFLTLQRRKFVVKLDNNNVPYTDYLLSLYLYDRGPMNMTPVYSFSLGESLYSAICNRGDFLIYIDRQIKLMDTYADEPELVGGLLKKELRVKCRLFAQHIKNKNNAKNK